MRICVPLTQATHHQCAGGDRDKMQRLDSLLETAKSSGGGVGQWVGPAGGAEFPQRCWDSPGLGLNAFSFLKPSHSKLYNKPVGWTHKTLGFLTPGYDVTAGHK